MIRYIPSGSKKERVEALMSMFGLGDFMRLAHLQSDVNHRNPKVIRLDKTKDK